MMATNHDGHKVYHDEAAAEAVKKWDGGHYSKGESVEVGDLRKFLKTGANLCNLVHFGDIRSSKVGQKIDAFHPTSKSGTEFTVPAV